MSKLLIKLFIKNYKNTNDSTVRRSYGNLASIFGIISNIFICLFKILFGLFFGLISLVADGFNNLADATSSIITLIGFKLSSKPADKDHPFGHARIEYIAGFIISIIIVILGIQLIYNSITDIISNWYTSSFIPLNNKEFFITIIILIFAIIGKIYQGYFYHIIGKTISSLALKAASQDSKNDVIATSVVLLGLILSKIFNFYIDGYLGTGVGIFIIISGFKLIKETSDPLIGEKPNKELIKSYLKFISSYEEILGIHDLQIHSYGPSTYFATLHVEVNAEHNILEIHDTIDNIEKECFKQFKIITTLHMDPVIIGDKYTDELKNIIIPLLNENKNITSVHDFRIVKGPTHINILFDAVINPESKLKNDEILKELELTITSIDKKFVPVITLDNEYSMFLKD